MTNEEIAVKIAELEQRCKSLSHRMDGVEDTQKSIAELARCVEVIATKQDYIAKQTDQIASKVETLEHAPTKKISGLFWTVLAAVLSSLATFVITKFFS